jgi:TROVE domain
MTERIHDRAYRETVAHQHVPGRAFDVADPAVRLIQIIGGGFFNEPKYYDSNRSAVAFYRELAETGCISSTIVDQLGLTEQAREVLETAWAVAGSEHPEDLLIIAAWARDTKDGLKLRTTPAMLLTLAAAHPRCKQFVRRYATAILQRPDEVRLVFASFRHFFQQAAEGRHRGALPHALRKGLAAALAESSDYELLKYNDDERPTLADVLKMVGGSRKLPGKTAAGWPVSKPMYQYLVNGTIGADAPATLQARQYFFSLKDVAEVSPDLIRTAGLTWENVVSHLGNSAAVWERVIPFMGEMALTRNLRNFEQASIFAATWQKVRDKLLAVEDTVQLPFRFFSAEREVTSADAREIVSLMLERSVANVIDLPGVTLVLVDNSGSCVGCAVSAKSKLRLADAGNMLAAVLARKVGTRAVVGVFGDSLVWVPFTDHERCLAIKKRIDALAQTEERSEHGALAIPQFERGPGVGQGTETGLWWGLHDVTRQRVFVDRIVLLSDLCCYTQGDNNCGHDMSQYFGKNATVQSMVDLYREKVNPKVCVYSVNLNGHAQSQFRPHGERTHLLSGWSEKLLNVIADLETDRSDEVTRPIEEMAVPALELLRERYRRQ